MELTPPKTQQVSRFTIMNNPILEVQESQEMANTSFSAKRQSNFQMSFDNTIPTPLIHMASLTGGSTVTPHKISHESNHRRSTFENLHDGKLKGKVQHEQ